MRELVSTLACHQSLLSRLILTKRRSAARPPRAAALVRRASYLPSAAPACCPRSASVTPGEKRPGGSSLEKRWSNVCRDAAAGARGCARRRPEARLRASSGRVGAGQRAVGGGARCAAGGARGRRAQHEVRLPTLAPRAACAAGPACAALGAHRTRASFIRPVLARWCAPKSRYRKRGRRRQGEQRMARFRRPFPSVAFRVYAGAAARSALCPIAGHTGRCPICLIHLVDPTDRSGRSPTRPCLLDFIQFTM